MPINKKGGKKHKRGKHRSKNSSLTLADRAKDALNSESYGKVIKPLGDCRFLVQYQGPSGMIEAPCTMSRSINTRINKDAYVLVLVGVYSETDKKGKIVDVYSSFEVENLKRAGLWDYEEAELESQGFKFTNITEEEYQQMTEQQDAEDELVAEKVRVRAGVEPALEEDFDIDAI